MSKWFRTLCWRSSPCSDGIPAAAAAAAVAWAAVHCYLQSVLSGFFEFYRHVEHDGSILFVFDYCYFQTTSEELSIRCRTTSENLSRVVCIDDLHHLARCSYCNSQYSEVAITHVSHCSLRPFQESTEGWPEGPEREKVWVDCRLDGMALGWLGFTWQIWGDTVGPQVFQCFWLFFYVFVACSNASASLSGVKHRI